MRIDVHKVRIMLATKAMRRKDLVGSGIPLGTVNGAMNGNNIGKLTAERFARALDCNVDEITMRGD